MPSIAISYLNELLNDITSFGQSYEVYTTNNSFDIYGTGWSWKPLTARIITEYKMNMICVTNYRIATGKNLFKEPEHVSKIIVQARPINKKYKHIKPIDLYKP